MAKFGTRLGIRGRWPHKRLYLDHEYKRFIAKKLVSGMSPKELAAELGLHVQTVYKVQATHVVISLTERFPDPEAPTLPADENNAPAGSVELPRGIPDGDLKQMAEAHRFEVIDGGLVEPKPANKPPGGSDWLRSLPYGARFLCRPAVYRGYKLDAYGIAYITDEAILLGENTPDGLSFFWVDSQLFSNMNKFVALLPNPPEEEEINEGNPSVTAPSGSDDDHEGPPRSLPSPEQDGDV